MSYKIEQLTNPRAIFVTLNEDFKIPQEIVAYTKEVASLLEKEARPIPIVVDMRQYSVSFEALLSGTNLALNPEANITKYPNAGKLILITRETLLKMSMDGFRKLGIASNIQAVSSPDEALALCANT
jgi:hypothetical protein